MLKTYNLICNNSQLRWASSQGWSASRETRRTCDPADLKLCSCPTRKLLSWGLECLWLSASASWKAFSLETRARALAECFWWRRPSFQPTAGGRHCTLRWRTPRLAFGKVEALSVGSNNPSASDSHSPRSRSARRAENKVSRWRWDARSLSLWRLSSFRDPQFEAWMDKRWIPSWWTWSDSACRV